MTLPDPYANDPAARRARSRRNWAIAFGLIAFMALVFLITVTRMGGHVADRPL